ncbi:spore germination protein [Brevibacillus sp. AG]|uniref:spore germination protein n=1 Tax=Brevibacillus sp. AG TaxID=3020891 RepID=UPI0008532216|nr:spore germination protein [Brevibacillus sp. AG]MDC0765079.1 spore germination protein [Brevibacillus sp. AG]
MTQIDGQTIHRLFEKCPDVHFQNFYFGEQANHRVLLVQCTGMVDQEAVQTIILKRLDLFLEKMDDPYLTKPTVLKGLHVPDIKEINDEQEVISEVFSGKLLLYFAEPKLTFSTDISKRPQRSPEESKMEVTIKGPRDNFIEDISINIALIRKRLPTNSMCIETFQLGRRSKTEISILYMNDIANPGTIEEIRNKISSVDIDAIYSGQQLMELIEKKNQIFPRYHYTGRPDFVVQALLSGRVTIMIDSVSYAIITPANLFMLLKTAEDTEYPALYSSFERLMRIVGILVATLLPAFWVALTAFHQNQIPFTLLSNVVGARTGVPLPTPLEALVMLLLFELFREAGLRLPMAIGQTLSVVGGLIIGDAAIRAGLTSPAMVVVIATSTIATFTLVNQSLVSTISILRFFALVSSSIFGFFGFCMSIFFVFSYLAKIRIFGIYYLDLAMDINLSNILKAMIRRSARKNITRPQMFNPQDPSRKGRD